MKLCVCRHTIAYDYSNICLYGIFPNQNYKVIRICLEQFFICFLNPISSFSSGGQQSSEATSHAQDPTIHPVAKPTVILPT